jgi:hypothetical protein
MQASMRVVGLVEAVRAAGKAPLSRAAHDGLNLVHIGCTSAQPDRDWFTMGLDTTQIRPI